MKGGALVSSPGKSPQLINPRYSEPPLSKASKTLRSAGTWNGRQQTQIAVRQFSFTADQPAAKGGRDHGPSPMEYLISGVNACITVVIDQLAQRRKLPVTGISTYTISRQDARGLSGEADVQPYFYAYRLQLVIETPERDEVALQSFAQEAEHACPAVNLLRDAHIELDVAWSFVQCLEPKHAESLANQAWSYAAASSAAVGLPFYQVLNADDLTDTSATGALLPEGPQA